MSDNNIAVSGIEEENMETPCRLKSNIPRRTSFFRRKSVLQTQDYDESGVACNKQKQKRRISNESEIIASSDNFNKKIQEPEFDLQKYINDLKQERKEWRRTFRQRERQHKTLLKQTTNMQHGEQDLDLNVLSESERSFLLSRPNYEHIYEKAKKLAVMAVETEILNEHVMHLHKQHMLRAQEKLDNLTTRVIGMVD